MNDEDLSDFARFVFELGQLKRTTRSGWTKLGIDRPETVAEHSFRTAVLGFLLAELEGAKPYEVAGFCLFHDMAEARTLDLDWLAQDYLDRGDYLSSRILGSQTSRLPEELGQKLRELMDRAAEKDKTARVARDADLLDLLFQALEYSHQGNPLARKWFFNTASSLSTESGKKIANFLREKEKAGELEDLLTWWEGLDVSQDRDK